MISMTIQAIVVEDPKTEDFCCDAVHGSNDMVRVDLNGLIETIKFQHLGQFCANRGYNFQIETIGHTFKPRINDDGREPDLLEDALNGRR